MFHYLRFVHIISGSGWPTHDDAGWLGHHAGDSGYMRWHWVWSGRLRLEVAGAHDRGAGARVRDGGWRRCVWAVGPNRGLSYNALSSALDSTLGKEFFYFLKHCLPRAPCQTLDKVFLMFAKCSLSGTRQKSLSFLKESLSSASCTALGQTTSLSSVYSLHSTNCFYFSPFSPNFFTMFI